MNIHFVPGLDLAEGFFREAVGPIVDAVIPGLEYSAALIGRGSEVLGFDTEMSTDHDWGPRAMLFLRLGDVEIHGPKLSAVLGERLPLSYRGYPTSWSQPDAGDNGTQCLCQTEAYPINHRVEILSIEGFLGHYLGVDVDAGLRACWPPPILDMTEGPAEDYARKFLKRSSPFDTVVVLARGRFEIQDPQRLKACLLSLDYYGGVAVYVNGKEAVRGHLPGQETNMLARLADPYPEKVLPKGSFEATAACLRQLREVEIPVSMLRSGINVLAV